MRRDWQFKIGASRDPRKRARVLCGSLVWAIQTDAAFALEKVLHNHFGDKRIGGEWFDLTADDLAWFHSLGPRDVALLLATGDRRANREPVPPEFAGRRTTKGAKQCNAEVDAALFEEFKAMCDARGDTLRKHLEWAMRRHLDNLPPHPAIRPLPPVPPAEPEPKKGKRK